MARVADLGILTCLILLSASLRSFASGDASPRLGDRATWFNGCESQVSGANPVDRALNGLGRWRYSDKIQYVIRALDSQLSLEDQKLTIIAVNLEKGTKGIHPVEELSLRVARLLQIQRPQKFVARMAGTVFPEATRDASDAHLEFSSNVFGLRFFRNLGLPRENWEKPHSTVQAVTQLLSEIIQRSSPRGHFGRPILFMDAVHEFDGQESPVYVRIEGRDTFRLPDKLTRDLTELSEWARSTLDEVPHVVLIVPLLAEENRTSLFHVKTELEWETDKGVSSGHLEALPNDRVRILETKTAVGKTTLIVVPNL
jgi:hypothetical protein